MKIAIVVCTFPPYRGGIGNAAYEQARELVKLGNGVVVYTPRYNNNLKLEEKIDGLNVKRLKPVLRYGNGAFLPQLMWKLKGYDVVFLHYPFFGGAEVVWLRRILHIGSTAPIATGDYGASRVGKQRLVIYYHMDVVGKGLLGWFFRVHARFWMPLIVRAGERVIVSSMDYARNSQVSSLIDGRFVEIPFGVDVSQATSNKLPLDATSSMRFRTDRGRQIPNKIQGTNNQINDRGKTVLFIGALDKAHYFKGVDVLIEAMALLKDRQYKCVIVGDGDMKEEYERKVKEMGLDNVVFAGRVSDEEKVGYLKRADVLVLPSIDKSEAFGIVLIEAMACGIPVIASDLAGVRSVVDDGVNGFLVKPKNVGELANRIEYVLSHPDEAKKIGENGRLKIEDRYNWEKIGKRLSDVLK